MSGFKKIAFSIDGFSLNKNIKKIGGSIEVCLKNIKIFIEVSEERFKQNLKKIFYSFL
jgi:hypothetical protein